MLKMFYKISHQLELCIMITNNVLLSEIFKFGDRNYLLNVTLLRNPYLNNENITKCQKCFIKWHIN